MLGDWQRKRRCARALSRCQAPALTRWLEACRDLRVGTLAETDIISLDLELTGLDPEHDEILSLGWTEITRGRIRLSTSRHLLLRPTRGVGASATIHELRDRDLLEGGDPGAALETLFSAAQGKLFLFHHAGLDAACLQRACERWAGCRPPIPAIDTLQLEASRRRRRGQTIPDGALRLGALRAHYGLPEHPLHDALGDAVATAELFLAMASRMGGKGSAALSPLVQLR